MRHGTLLVDELPEPAASSLREHGVVGVEPFIVGGELIAFTARSTWIIRYDRFMRMPVEDLEASPETPAKHFADCQWRGLRIAYWAVTDTNEQRIWLCPLAGPSRGIGVITGIVTDIVEVD